MAQQRGMKHHHLNLDVMLSEIHPAKDVNLKECLAIAKHVADLYIRSGFVKRLLKHQELSLQSEVYKIVGGVPLLGKLDVLLSRTIPMDFKTRGWGANYATPHEGYTYRWNENGGEDYPSMMRPEFHDNNEDWFEQMCFYSWMTGGEPDCIIHEVCNTKTGVVFVEHIAKLDKIKQAHLFKQVEMCWEQINTLNVHIEEPTPNMGKCYKYDQMCDVAHRCTKFQELVGYHNGRDK